MQIGFIQRHLLLWATLASTGLHLWLLWPERSDSPLAPKPLVINAKLQKPNAKQPELQPAAENLTSTTKPSRPAPQQPHSPSAAKPSRPAPLPTILPASSQPHIHPAPTASPQEAQIGLSMSQDELAIDPLERSFQQQILAHLRNKIRAPESWHGSVRLEIQYSYRQIITQVRIIRSSQNDAFDDWAIKAILSANPYPKVPADLPENYVFRPTLQVAE